MASILTLILDICFPPRAEEILVRTLSTDTIYSLYSEVTYAGATALLPYSNHTIKALIHEAKFHDNKHAQTLLGYALNLYTNKYDLIDCVFIPIPLSHKRWRERGYNQVTQILKKTELHTATAILYRTRHTITQTSLDRKARLKNMKDAFVIKGTMPTRSIIIVDDVLTTGATLDAARMAFVDHLGEGQTIHCIALAH